MCPGIDQKDRSPEVQDGQLIANADAAPVAQLQQLLSDVLAAKAHYFNQRQAHHEKVAELERLLADAQLSQEDQARERDLLQARVLRLEQQATSGSVHDLVEGDLRHELDASPSKHAQDPALQLAEVHALKEECRGQRDSQTDQVAELHGPAVAEPARPRRPSQAAREETDNLFRAYRGRIEELERQLAGAQAAQRASERDRQRLGGRTAELQRQLAAAAAAAEDERAVTREELTELRCAAAVLARSGSGGAGLTGAADDAEAAELARADHCRVLEARLADLEQRCAEAAEELRAERTAGPRGLGVVEDFQRLLDGERLALGAAEAQGRALSAEAAGLSARLRKSEAAADEELLRQRHAEGVLSEELRLELAEARAAELAEARRSADHEAFLAELRGRSAWDAGELRAQHAQLERRCAEGAAAEEELQRLLAGERFTREVAEADGRSWRAEAAELASRLQGAVAAASEGRLEQRQAEGALCEARSAQLAEADRCRELEARLTELEQRCAADAEELRAQRTSLQRERRERADVEELQRLLAGERLGREVAEVDGRTAREEAAELGLRLHGALTAGEERLEQRRAEGARCEALRGELTEALAARTGHLEQRRAEAARCSALRRELSQARGAELAEAERAGGLEALLAGLERQLAERAAEARTQREALERQRAGRAAAEDRVAELERLLADTRGSWREAAERAAAEGRSGEALRADLASLERQLVEAVAARDACLESRAEELAGAQGLERRLAEAQASRREAAQERDALSWLAAQLRLQLAEQAAVAQRQRGEAAAAEERAAERERQLGARAARLERQLTVAEATQAAAPAARLLRRGASAGGSASWALLPAPAAEPLLAGRGEPGAEGLFGALVAVERQVAEALRVPEDAVAPGAAAVEGAPQERYARQCTALLGKIAELQELLTAMGPGANAGAVRLRLVELERRLAEAEALRERSARESGAHRARAAALEQELAFARGAREHGERQLRVCRTRLTELRRLLAEGR